MTWAWLASNLVLQSSIKNYPQNGHVRVRLHSRENMLWFAIFQSGWVPAGFHGWNHYSHPNNKQYHRSQQGQRQRKLSHFCKEHQWWNCLWSKEVSMGNFHGEHSPFFAPPTWPIIYLTYCLSVLKLKHEKKNHKHSLEAKDAQLRWTDTPESTL